MRNQQYEQALERQGVEFTYAEKVALAEIDLAKGMRNQARLLTPLDDALVEEYRTLYQQGSKAPAVVLGRAGKGRWVPVDGNQRLAAMTAEGWKFTDAYLLQTTDQLVLDRVSWSFNNLVNGKRLTREECLEHACTMVRKYGVEVKEAATEWRIPYWQVKKKLQVLDLQDALDRNKVKRTPSLTEDKVYRLAPIVNLGEDIFARAAEVVAESGMATDQIEELCVKVKRAKTHEAKIQAIEDFDQSDAVRAKRAETKGGTVKSPGALPRDQLARKVDDMLRLIDNYDKAGLRQVGKEFRVTRGKVMDLTNKLIAIFGLGALLPETEVG